MKGCRILQQLSATQSPFAISGLRRWVSGEGFGHSGLREKDLEIRVRMRVEGLRVAGKGSRD
jgi:hypothetical protein